MATHNFNVKITTGKKTELEISVLGTAVNERTIRFIETDSVLRTNQMEIIIENAIYKALGSWIEKENFNN